MIARPKEVADAGGARNRWKVLVDSEEFGVSADRVESETFENPLPERLRFTVAHELAHTLAFRASEFGVELDRKQHRQSLASLVEDLESETNKLAPLLLVSDAALLEKCSNRSSGVDLSALVDAREGWAVSRSVLVSRLNLLNVVDVLHLRTRQCLSNIIVGVGEWKSGSSAILRDWPVFINFGGNLVPEFVLRLRSKIAGSLDEILGQEAVLNERGVNQSVLETLVGTSLNPSLEMGKIRFFFEETPRRAGQSFLYMVKPEN
jgi:hypothetical protein